MTIYVVQEKQSYFTWMDVLLLNESIFTLKFCLNDASPLFPKKNVKFVELQRCEPRYKYF